MSDQGIAQLRQANQKLRSSQHQKRNRIIQLQCELEYQRKRSSDLQAKFRQQLMHSSADAKIQQLTRQLAAKENQLLETRVKQIQKKRVLATRIEQLRLEVARVPKLEQQTANLREQLEKVREGAVQAIMEKQGVITGLEEELRVREEVQPQADYLELKGEYEHLLEKYQQEGKAYEAKLETKRQELAKLSQRMQSDQQQFQDRLLRLQSQINQRMQHNLAQTLSSARVQQSSLLQTVQALQQKLHKSQSHSLQLYTQLQKLKFQHQSQKRKLQQQRDSLLEKYKQEVAAGNREMDNMARAREKEVQELQAVIEKGREQVLGLQKKVEGLQGERVKNEAEVWGKGVGGGIVGGERGRKGSRASVHQEEESETGRGQGPRGLTNQIEDIKVLEESSFNFSEWSPKQDETVQVATAAVSSAIIPKLQQLPGYLALQQQNSRLKKQLQQIQNTLQSQNSSISLITRQLQSQRQKVLTLTNKRSQLVVQLQSLRSHTFKVQSTLLTEKLKHAEELDFVKENYQVERKEFTIKLIRLNEEKAEMMMELDRLRKKTGVINASAVLNSPFKVNKNL